MKRLFKLSLLLLALLLPATATAYDFEVDGIYYNIINGYEAEVTSGDGYSGDVTIPSSVTYNGTTYSVTTIDDAAFWLCSGLTSIYIPNSVMTIGDQVFFYCRGLTSITIPNSVTTIGDEAFRGCSGLTSIIVESGNPNYDSRNNCNAIIETATNKLIAGCMNTTIPNSVTSIGGYAFCDCSGLASVTIPNSVTSIGDNAFNGCNGLTSVTIGNSVTYIGHVAFSGCSGLTSVTIPNSVTYIGMLAFSGCSGLSSVTIPNSVTTIFSSAFIKCSGLAGIIVESGNPNYDSRNNCNAIIETSTNTLITGCMNTIIPNSVTSICIWAFYGCSGLTSVDIPNSVTSIGDYAFYDCSGLNDVFSFIDDPTIVSMGDDVFFYLESNNYTERTLHVPFGCVSAYQADTKWSQYFGSIVEIVPVLAEAIKLNVTTAGLNEGATLQLMATVLPEDCDNKNVIWASNNPSVATVDSNGLVTTHGVGTATITAITADGSNLSTTCTVTLLPVGIKGDVNGDSVIDIDDVTKLINYLLKGSWSN